MNETETTKWSEVRLKAEVRARYGLPDTAYWVDQSLLLGVMRGTGELPLSGLLYGLQQMSQLGGGQPWKQHEPAMDRLSELMAPEDPRTVISVSGDHWWLEIGPVDLNGPIVTIQRGDSLIAAMASREDGRLRVAVFRPLDAKSAQYLISVSQKPHPVHGVCMRENNWEYALDNSVGFRHWYADERGEAYMSCWTQGLGIADSGEVNTEWRDQLNLTPRPAVRVVAELGTYETLSASPDPDPPVDMATDHKEDSAPYVWPRKRQQARTVRGRFLGCLVGGAVGDALGAPVEFMKLDEIKRCFGSRGIRDFASAYGGIGRITDDTQMTLFTAEGLLRGWVRSSFKGVAHYPTVVCHAYMRWLHTQGYQGRFPIPLGTDDSGWLYRQSGLHHRRAPGNTCLSALQEKRSLDDPVTNLSKGCGGVMRVAPVGLFASRLGWRELPDETFRLGCDVAALTHGHTTGVLSAGVLAVLVLALIDGASIKEALQIAKFILMQHSGHEETLVALEAAERLADSEAAPEQAVRQLGEGWVAEEALAISVYCALKARNFRHGVIMAVNHDGDSDSTGAITGHLLGTQYGYRSIPQDWVEQLELSDVIREMAEDLYAFVEWKIGEFSHDETMNRLICNKYPGH